MANPLQYSCLENHMDRGAWRAMVYRVAKSQTRLKQLGTHTYRKLQDILSPKKRQPFPSQQPGMSAPSPV